MNLQCNAANAESPLWVHLEEHAADNPGQREMLAEAKSLGVDPAMILGMLAQFAQIAWPMLKMFLAGLLQPVPPVVVPRQPTTI